MTMALAEYESDTVPSSTLILRTITQQIIASMSPPSTMGRHQLSTRFTARVRVAALTYPDRDSLQAIYTQMVSRVRCKLLHNVSMS